LYKSRNAATFGISGDRTQHIIWRIENGNFEGIKPGVVVLEIGVNNFPVHNADEISQGIKAILKSLQKKAPAAKILLLGPLPTGRDNTDPNRQKYKQVHQMIKSLGNGKSIVYLNLDQVFLKPDGTLTEGLMAADAIHLTPGGYRAWASAMEPEMKKMMGK
jgi:lysophospholipase L1-like esterase